MIDTTFLRRTAHRIFWPTRQNHALEHATVAVLMQRSEVPLRVVGSATPFGFYLVGDLGTEEVESAAHEALERMRRGDDHLAVSPFCGTNLLIAGTLATLASLVTLGTKDRRQKLPTAIAAATFAVALAQPVGAWVQRNLTTTQDLSDMRIVRVTRSGPPGRTVHKVETARLGAYAAAA